MQHAKPISQAEIIAAVARQPASLKLVADDRARIVAERQAHVERIAALDRQAEIDWPKASAAVDAAAAKLRAAERALRAANDELSAAAAAKSSVSHAYTVARQAEEAALIAGADVAAITAWKRECLDEGDALRRPSVLVTVDASERHPLTRQMIRNTRSNAASVRARMAAVLESYRNADALALEPDQTRLAALISAMREAWPKLDQNPGAAS